MSWYYFLCQDDHNELRRFVASYMWVGPLGLTLEILVEKKKNNIDDIKVIFRSISGSWSHLTEPYWLCLKLNWNCGISLDMVFIFVSLKLLFVLWKVIFSPNRMISSTRQL